MPSPGPGSPSRRKASSNAKGPCASAVWANWARWTPPEAWIWTKRKKPRKNPPKRRNNMPREIITIECTEARKEGKSPSRYTTTRNKKLKTEKLEIKKYNPALRRHTLHREIK